MTRLAIATSSDSEVRDPASYSLPAPIQKFVRACEPVMTVNRTIGYELGPDCLQIKDPDIGSWRATMVILHNRDFDNNNIYYFYFNKVLVC